MSPAAASMLEELVARRRSVRGFQDKAVPHEDLERLFAMAQKAPSWCNIQPWRVQCTEAAVTEKVRQALLQAATKGLPTPDLAFPLVYPEPYGQHRKECGVALYGAMEVTREDKEGRHNAWLRNYEIFDAPHLMVVSRDRRLGEYATLDVGVWLGFLLVAAESLGISACAMASVAAYPQPLRDLLEIPEDEAILFGVALGYEDEDVPANRVRTTRDETAKNLRFHS